MAEDVGERTESATPRRREQARNRGQVATSRDLNGAAILLAAVVSFHVFGLMMLGEAIRVLRYCLGTPWLDLSIERVRIEIAKLAILAFLALLPILSILVATALGVNIFQTRGLLLAYDKNYFNLNAINPINGFQRIFSTRTLVRVATDLAKVAVVGTVAYLFISGELLPLSALLGMPFPVMGGYAFNRFLTLGYSLVAVLLTLGAADYAFQIYQNERDMKMTRQEVKEEGKDVEGDPQIKSRRRQIQAELARQRMMQAVPEAEVVITNPTEIAVALKYNVDEMDAPMVVALGAGNIAQRIRELANENGIPIIENKPLARYLFKSATLDRMIPEDTFQAVAEILAYVYQISGRRSSDMRHGRGDA
ncbi:Flagellar biosynthetic protein FlhB [Planctomycetes bacterium Pan216]|uniref:Flagellar biosynthetic protein FlhB n=1 Tax=Kolteria novifilia TaxID=2527975 RepID=A0A518B972_9BACT|nr:Flagellar biosynthetic protein FlhB [Planctomycetes bacterium Pan216]